MRQHFLRRAAVIALFVALAFAGDRLLGAAAGHIVRESGFRLSQLYRGAVDADIAIFGNSRGVHSLFGPRLAEATCRKTFNASYNGLTAISTSLAVKDYLERNRKPQFILVEATASSWWNRTAAELKTFTTVSERFDRLFRAIDRRYRYWTLLTHLHRFDTELFLRCLLYLHRDDQDWIMEGVQIDRGAIEAFGGLAAEALDNSPRRLEALHHLAQAVKEAGVQPIFFIAPYHPVVFERSPQLAGWLEEQKAALAQDAPVIDLSRALSADEDFGDPLHLNKTGSYRLIAELLQTPQGKALSLCDANR